jgi:membrane protein
MDSENQTVLRVFESHLMEVQFAGTKRALRNAFNDSIQNRTFQAAAALSYYSILATFPVLILLSAVMGYIPLPNFFADALVAMARVLPGSTVMPMVYSVLIGVLGANLRAWVSLGTLGTLWVVSSAFDEMIDALDAAYDVTDPRPFWKVRLLAVGLAAISGVLLISALAILVVGPKAGEWLAGKLALSHVFLFFWPILHRTIAIGFAVFAVQLNYYLAPNIRRRFVSTLPGALLSVACWMALSFLLDLYFRYFANYNRIYGTLAGVMALMTWLYWAYFIFLAGGELNAELAKTAGAGRLPLKSDALKVAKPAA